MAVSEAQKRAAAKWDKAHRKSVACTISLEEHAAFKAYAEARGKTVSGMMLDYIRLCISTEQPKDFQETTEQQNPVE